MRWWPVSDRYDGGPAPGRPLLPGWLRWLVWSLVLAVAGCAQLPFLERPDPCLTEEGLFVDRFDHEDGANACNWAIFRTPGAAVALNEEALELSISHTGQVTWSNPGRSFEDVVINAEVRQLSGPNNNAYGLICRYQDASNFYLFIVSGDGFYAIGRYSGDSAQITYLTGEPPDYYVASPFINQGAATNNLTASCVGSELSLAINGQEVAQVTDDVLPAGDIGVAAGVFEAGRLVVAFESIEVSGP